MTKTSETITPQSIGITAFMLMVVLDKVGQITLRKAFGLGYPYYLISKLRKRKIKITTLNGTFHIIKKSYRIDKESAAYVSAVQILVRYGFI